MISHSDLPTLPSGRSLEDIKVQHWRVNDIPFASFKVRDHWHLYVRYNGQIRMLTDKGEDFLSVRTNCMTYYQQMLLDDITKLKKMLEDF